MIVLISKELTINLSVMPEESAKFIVEYLNKNNILYRKESDICKIIIQKIRRGEIFCNGLMENLMFYTEENFAVRWIWLGGQGCEFAVEIR